MPPHPWGHLPAAVRGQGPPAIRPGGGRGKLLFPESEFLAWLASHADDPTA